MKNMLLRATILVVLFFIPKMVFGNVIINEIAWMGTTIDYNNEWMELENISSASVDLTGWTLEAADGQPKINLSGIIPANGYFLLERTDDTSVPSIVADQIYTGALGNSGENLKLKNNTNNIVDSADFASGWPNGDNTTKQTMEKSSTDWQTSLNPGGTPKAQNSSGAVEESGSTTETPEAPLIIANENPPIADAGDNIIGFVNQEIKLDGSKSSDPDGNELQYSWNTGDGNSSDHQIVLHKYLYPGTYLAVLTVYDNKTYVTDTITVQIQQAEITINEFLPNPTSGNGWIEIYNNADSIIDISGWQLGNTASESSAFTFPKNTFIAPKSYLVFSQQTTKIALDNNADSVKLIMPGRILFQEINYENPPQGKSSARTAEGFIWSEPTPGMVNVSSIVINPDKQTISQINPVQPQVVKESSANYVINLPDNEINGGYTQDTNSQAEDLASIKQSSPQNPLNLVLLIICVVFASGFIGLLLVKFKKKDLPRA